MGGNPPKSIGKQVGIGERQSPPETDPLPSCLIALLPYCLAAQLPYCLIASLPYCPIAFLPLPFAPSLHRGPKTGNRGPIPPSPLSGSRFSKVAVIGRFAARQRWVSIPFKRVSVQKVTE